MPIRQCKRRNPNGSPSHPFPSSPSELRSLFSRENYNHTKLDAIGCYLPLRNSVSTPSEEPHTARRCIRYPQRTHTENARLRPNTLAPHLSSLRNTLTLPMLRCPLLLRIPRTPPFPDHHLSESWAMNHEPPCMDLTVVP